MYVRDEEKIDDDIDHKYSYACRYGNIRMENE